MGLDVGRKFMTLHTFLALLGTACGIYYTYLGVVVGGYAVDAEKRKSPSARILLTGVVWSVGPGDEYSEVGKQICRKGNWVTGGGHHHLVRVRRPSMTSGAACGQCLIFTRL